MPRKKTVPASRQTFPIVGVGASAGGLEAFRSLLQKLPANTGMAFVLVQHLDPEHESLLTRLLSHATRMPVTEVTEGVAVEPDHVYVIPPNKALGIRNGVLHLLARRRQDPKHMPVDAFLHSLAENEGSRAIGVILSGVATDGTLGLAAIKAAGGITFAQDSQSAKYDGMPRSAIAAGCVDFVLPPEGIARELKRVSLHPYLGRPDHSPAGDRQRHRDEDLLKIFVLLRHATGVDFTHYKRSTIHRRIARRMVLHKISSLRQYLKYLHENRVELMALYEDLLIHVTSFFREPDAFRALKETVLPRIFRNKAKGEPLRDLGGGLLHGRGGVFDRHHRTGVSRSNTRVPCRFKSSGPTSAMRSSNKPGRASIPKAPCRPSRGRACANSSSAPTAGIRSRRRCAKCAFSRARI